MQFIRHTPLALSSCLALFAVTALQADQVVLKNGDRVSGSIVKKDGKDLTIKTDMFGVVTAPWDQVVSVTADKPLHVVLQGDKEVQGTIATSEGKIAVAGQNVPPAEVVTIRDPAEQAAYERLLTPPWTRLWAGAGSIGLSGTAGNARTTTFNIGVQAARLTRTDKTTIHLEAIKASALVEGKSADTAEAIRGGLAYDHNIGSRLFANVFNDWEYDKFQNLDLRFVIGGGLGLHAWKNERSQFNLQAGADYNRSSYNTPATTKSAEAYWGDDYALRLTKVTSVVQNFRMFNDLTHTGDYRVNFDLGVTTKVARWLTWNLSASDRYLNHPALGRKTNDFLYTTGLGITFSR